jgi:hypothetical protein
MMILSEVSSVDAGQAESCGEQSIITARASM